MSTFTGFIAVTERNGKRTPVMMDLHEDITAGAIIGGSIPVFVDQRSADEAFLNHAQRYTDNAKAEIVAVTVTLGAVVGKSTLESEE